VTRALARASLICLAIASCGCGGCDRPEEQDPDRGAIPYSSNTPIATEPTEAAVRAQLESLVRASLDGGGMAEANDLRWPEMAYSDLEALFGYYHRNDDPDAGDILKTLAEELPRAIRELAAGGEIEIQIGNHADGTLTPRQSSVRVMLEASKRRAMFWAKLRRKGGAAPGRPSVVFLENLTLLEGRFRYMGPLVRGAGKDCARLAAGAPAAPQPAATREGLPSGVRAKASVPGPVLDVAWAPNGDEVMIVTPDGTLAWDPQWIAAPRSILFWSDWFYCAVGYEGDAGSDPPKRAALAFGGSGKYGPDPSAVMLGPDRAARLLYRPSYYAHERARFRGATAAALSASGRLAIAKRDGSVCLGESPSCSDSERAGGVEAIVALAFSRDDRLAGATASGTVVLFASPPEEKRVAIASVDRIAWSPSARFLVAFGPAGMIGVGADADPASVPAAVATPRAAVRAAAFAASGSLVIATDRGTVAIAHDLAQPVFTTLAEVDEPLASIAVSDSAGIVAATRSGTLYVVDLPPNERVAEKLPPPSQAPLTLHMSGDTLYLGGYTVEGVGDPPVPIAELRRRLLATPGATMLLESVTDGFDPRAEAALAGLAQETGATIERKKLLPGIE
jgi:hypothetical protein